MWFFFKGGEGGRGSEGSENQCFCQASFVDGPYHFQEYWKFIISWSNKRWNKENPQTNLSLSCLPDKLWKYYLKECWLIWYSLYLQKALKTINPVSTFDKLFKVIRFSDHRIQLENCNGHEQMFFVSVDS